MSSRQALSGQMPGHWRTDSCISKIFFEDAVDQGAFANAGFADDHQVCCIHSFFFILDSFEKLTKEIHNIVYDSSPHFPYIISCIP